MFLDESGGFPKDGDRYFVVGSFTVGNPRRTAKAFLSWRASRFPRRLRRQAEVKFSDSHIDERLRLRTIHYLSKLDVRVVASFLAKENIPAAYRATTGLKQTGLLYASVVAETLEHYCPPPDGELRVFRDMRHLQGLTSRAFNDLVRAHVSPRIPAGSVCIIQAVDSTTNPNIQIADWICGALGRYHNQKERGEEFYRLIKNNMISHQELFPSYWETRWQTEKPTAR